ncbi:MAG: tripartite tricarboxylate transporter TctB family protein [Hyphomicrobiaceae bacterium]
MLPSQISRDTVIALVLLVFTGTFLWASFDIKEPDYGVLSPAAWPRVVLGALIVLSFILLFQSLREPIADKEPTDPQIRGLSSLIAYWRNPLYCFASFWGFLLVLPYLGMLVGGILFVFVILTLLGGTGPQKLALHALIATVSIGAMWSLFTFGLRVILPAGSLFDGRI